MSYPAMVRDFCRCEILFSIYWATQMHRISLEEFTTGSLADQDMLYRYFVFPALFCLYIQFCHWNRGLVRSTAT